MGPLPFAGIATLGFMDHEGKKGFSTISIKVVCILIETQPCFAFKIC